MNQNTQSEKVLKESELQQDKRFKEFLNIIGVLVVELDVDGTVLALNNKGCEILEYAKDELVGKNWFNQVISPDKREEVKKVFDNVLKGKCEEINYNTNELITKKGKHKMLLFHNAYVLGQENIPKIISSGIDITDHINLEEQLNEEKLKLRGMLDGNKELVGLLTPEGILIEVNLTALNFVGAKSVDVLNKPFADTIWWSYSKTTQRKINEAIAGAAKGETAQFEIEIPNKKGELQIIDFSLTPIKNESGEIIFLMPEGKNISFYKQIEEELKSSKEFINEVVNAVMNPVFVKDEKHRFVLVNDAFCEFVGRKREELLGNNDLLFFPEDQVKIFWQKDDIVMNESTDSVNEEKLTGSDGVIKYIVTKKRKYVDKEGHKFLVGVISDLSNIKKLGSELIERNQELEKFNQFSVDRELKMIELKKEINELLLKLKQNIKYGVAE
ncbi:MAG: PAS domain-containing protein [Candidatus Nanoarchaeia archaeon]